jgi:hypothetical protein
VPFYLLATPGLSTARPFNNAHNCGKVESMNQDDIRKEFEKCKEPTEAAYREVAYRLVQGEMQRNATLRNVLLQIESESTEENIRRIAHDGIRNNEANGNVIAA